MSEPGAAVAITQLLPPTIVVLHWERTKAASSASCGNGTWAETRAQLEQQGQRARGQAFPWPICDT